MSHPNWNLVFNFNWNSLLLLLLWLLLWHKSTTISFHTIAFGSSHRKWGVGEGMGKEKERNQSKLSGRCELFKKGKLCVTNMNMLHFMFLPGFSFILIVVRFAYRVCLEFLSIAFRNMMQMHGILCTGIHILYNVWGWGMVYILYTIYTIRHILLL